MSDFTPGPWFVEYDGPSLPIISAANRTVAMVRGLNAEENARLIAAAPALHAAAEAMVHAIADWSSSPTWGGPEMDEFTGPRYAALQAALALAKGETP